MARKKPRIPFFFKYKILTDSGKKVSGILIALSRLTYEIRKSYKSVCIMMIT